MLPRKLASHATRTPRHIQDISLRRRMWRTAQHFHPPATDVASMLPELGLCVVETTHETICEVDPSFLVTFCYCEMMMFSERKEKKRFKLHKKKSPLKLDVVENIYVLNFQEATITCSCFQYFHILSISQNTITMMKFYFCNQIPTTFLISPNVPLVMPRSSGWCDDDEFPIFPLLKFPLSATLLQQSDTEYHKQIGTKQNAIWKIWDSEFLQASVGEINPQ